MSGTRNNVRIFVLVTLACAVVAVMYTLFAARTARSAAAAVPAGELESASIVPLPLAAPMISPAVLPAVRWHGEQRDQAHVISLNVSDSPNLGKVEVSALQAIDDRTTTSLHCERIHFAASNGICLSRQVQIFSAQTIATVVDASFRPLFSVRADGIPTRARMSPDGRYAAFTVFVTGHSYADAQLSTATLLVDIGSRATLANLEDFEVLQDGNAIKSLDFNYWGVTFEQDSNFFYATLRTGGVNYLVRGDIKARTVTVLYKGVECPSLSPDETRIAFKKMISRAEWRLAVLSLATREETALPETRSVDDQVEWLDNERLLYALADPAPWMSIMVVPADGNGQPKVFAKGAASPAVVRHFRQ